MARNQAERYRQAAEDALGQLAKNRPYIRRQLMREVEQPVPSQTTRES